MNGCYVTVSSITALTRNVLQLAVELATRFRGEIINADAMQLYRGLPIITNKISPEEQRGIPHHLLGSIPLDGLPWDVTEFKKHATQTIHEIRSRGNLPILVGGTHYYVEPLLFQDAILDDVKYDASQSFPILDAPVEEMLKELRRVDPAMAEKWHPNDQRKIQRSLEIYLQTGKPASELYAQQTQRKETTAEEADKATRPWENLLFWVYSERQVLCDRLNTRVDKMFDAGLLDEVRELHEYKSKKTHAGTVLDMTKGIWQSIGYKQLEPYITATTDDEEELGRIKSAGLEDMKTATRRYANYQNKWIRTKQIPRLKECGEEAIDSLYLLDSTDASRYADNVTEPATRVLSQFLNGEGKQLPVELSPLAREVLAKATEPATRETPKQRVCEICHATLVTEEAWTRHVQGNRHRKLARKKKRLALVPIGEGVVVDAEAEESGERSSEPNTEQQTTDEK
jgi:tRNA dimethylallyltransferase